MASRVKVSGPIFDGEAMNAVRMFQRDTINDLAEQGQRVIQERARAMNKSGRGGTGAAAGGVKLTGGDEKRIISGGIEKGDFAWPWLEGKSKRNLSTGFKGYGTFKKTRLLIARELRPVAQRNLSRYLPMMGGES
jgi:hypothetical protein